MGSSSSSSLNSVLLLRCGCLSPGLLLFLLRPRPPPGLLRVPLLPRPLRHQVVPRLRLHLLPSLITVLVLYVFALAILFLNLLLFLGHDFVFFRYVYVNCAPGHDEHISRGPPSTTSSAPPAMMSTSAGGHKLSKRTASVLAFAAFPPPLLAMMSTSARGGGGRKGRARRNDDNRAPGHDEHISRGPPSRGLRAPGVSSCLVTLALSFPFRAFFLLCASAGQTPGCLAM